MAANFRCHGVSFCVFKLGCIALLLALGLANCVKTPAQNVTGTFFPSAAGDAQEGPVPLSYQLRSDVPAVEAEALQLRGELDLARRPYISQVFAYANQSLVPRNLQLDTLTPGMEFGFFPSAQTKVQLNYLPTIFGNQNFRGPHVFGQEFRATVSGQPTDKLRYSSQLGIFQTARFGHLVSGGAALVGAGSLSYAINDRLRVGGGYRRDILGNSILSATGLNLPGTSDLVGRVKQNLFFGSVEVKPTAKITVGGSYGGGFVEGHKVQTNPFQQFSLYGARPLIARKPGAHLQLLLPSYQFVGLGYQKDELGFGNLTLAAPTSTQAAVDRLSSSGAGMTTPPGYPKSAPKVGGYISPQQFYLNQFRLDSAGRIWKSLYYTAGGGIGTVNFKFAGTPIHLDQTNVLGAANASLITRLGRRVRLEQGWYFLQFGEQYRRNIFYAQSKFYL